MDDTKDITQYLVEELREMRKDIATLKDEFVDFKITVIAQEAERHGRGTVYGAIAGFCSGLLVHAGPTVYKFFTS